MTSRLKEILRRSQIHVLLATSPDNIFYAARYRPLEPFKTASSVIIPADGDEVLLAPKSEMGFVTEACLVKDRRFYDSNPSWCLSLSSSDSNSKDYVSAISLSLKELGLDKGSIGIEEKHTPSFLVQELKQALPLADFKASSLIFEESRMVKTDEEIERITQTVKRAEQSLLASYASVYEGQSELDFANKLKVQLSKQGADAIFVEISTGPRLPSHPSEHKMERGQVLHVDLGAACRGYSSDFCRNAMLIEERSESRKINETMISANREMVRRIEPGVRARDIFKTGVEAIKNGGIREYTRRHVGHGIGVSPHEPPLISPTDEQELRPGMVLCLETPYRVPSSGVIQSRERGGSHRGWLRHDFKHTSRSLYRA